MQIPEQVFAIDWSGALSQAAQRRGLRAAVCDVETGLATVGTGLATIRPGALRTEMEAQLVELARRSAPVVAGLDFSFSYPAWFLRELGCRSAPELWALAAAEGEQWLREPHPHFWGRRKGSGPPPGHRAPAWHGYRRCELALQQAQSLPAAVGAPGDGRPVSKAALEAALETQAGSESTSRRRLPSSSFQIGGAGAVGTGTLRGLPMLARLRAAGWSVWPFDAPRLPLLVEIYPRALTGPVLKSSAAARNRYLQQPRFHTLPAPARAEAEGSEDAFDALVSALVLRDHASSFAGLQQARDETERLEGAI